MQWGVWEHQGPANRAPATSCPVRLSARPEQPPQAAAESAGAELPCKYPRFTRFMTSLAVKFATSSTEHTGRGTDRNRERKRSASRWQPAQQGGEASCTGRPSVLGPQQPAPATWEESLSLNRSQFLLCQAVVGPAGVRGLGECRWARLWGAGPGGSELEPPPARICHGAVNTEHPTWIANGPLERG